MTLYGFFSLLGGVGLFLYGMSMMSSGLKQAAGDKLRSILERATANRFVAIVVGVLVTLLIQSSSATDIRYFRYQIRHCSAFPERSLYYQGLISYDMTVYLVIGAAIGSVTPNLLASLTTNRNGKWTAFSL